jgi:hypothetical protein
MQGGCRRSRTRGRGKAVRGRGVSVGMGGCAGGGYTHDGMKTQNQQATICSHCTGTGGAGGRGGAGGGHQDNTKLSLLLLTPCRFLEGRICELSGAHKPAVSAHPPNHPEQHGAHNNRPPTVQALSTAAPVAKRPPGEVRSDKGSDDEARRGLHRHYRSKSGHGGQHASNITRGGGGGGGGGAGGWAHRGATLVPWTASRAGGPIGGSGGLVVGGGAQGDVGNQGRAAHRGTRIWRARGSRQGCGGSRQGTPFRLGQLNHPLNRQGRPPTEPPPGSARSPHAFTCIVEPMILTHPRRHLDISICERHRPYKPVDPNAPARTHPHACPHENGHGEYVLPRAGVGRRTMWSRPSRHSYHSFVSTPSGGGAAAPGGAPAPGVAAASACAARRDALRARARAGALRPLSPDPESGSGPCVSRGCPAGLQGGESGGEGVGGEGGASGSGPAGRVGS